MSFFAHAGVIFPYLQVRVRHRDVVVLALILSQQLEPAADGTPEDLAHSERQRPHEVVPGRAIPVPHLHRQPPVPLVAAHGAAEMNQQEESDHYVKPHHHSKEKRLLCYYAKIILILLNIRKNANIKVEL